LDDPYDWQNEENAEKGRIIVEEVADPLREEQFSGCKI
jgi:hypothetical protein